MNDNRYPWYILVPERAGLTEIHQLNRKERILFIEESCYLSEKLASIYTADKMNIASLGNMVPQLHIHHIVRYRTDKAWPGPVWGAADAIPYTQQEIRQQIQLLASALK